MACSQSDDPHSGGTEFLTSTKKVKKHVLKVPSLVADDDGVAATAGSAAAVVGLATHPSPAQTAGTGSHAATMKDLVQVVLKELITERHSMLVEPDGSMWVPCSVCME